MDINFVRVLRNFAPSAFVIVGLIASAPGIAAQTGTNTVVKPAAQTGTNTVVRPAAQTGTNGVVRSSSQKEECGIELSLTTADPC